MKIVFFGFMACYFGQKINLSSEQHQLIFINESTSDEDIISHCECADILVSMVFDDRFASSSLKRILVPGVGVDRINFSQVPKNVKVLTCAAHEMAVTEYILSHVITYFRDLDSIGENFKSHYDWTDCSRLGGKARKQLSELTVGVIGGGLIGRKVSEIFTLFGSKCRCLTRFKFEGAGSVEFFPRAERDAFLNGCDVVIVACSVDEQTRNMIDYRALSLMSSDSLLINVARSECVDYDALADACRKRVIGRAVIDVWQFYPAEAHETSSPAWQDFSLLNNVIMTPHISAWTQTVIARRGDTLRRYIHEATTVQSIQESKA
ncbi:NAD(P)-dependent oxidoreductase [Brenneria uluponensis]|uniref:NAD(P)-dependent oxidoreductase n=1 Tax=Brenneria uluponensis TaxID=3057057 RepID=UPI0028EA0871|nr:NAD(P)-dependent oxidoreductase [Brenneria ulupoensis]